MATNSESRSALQEQLRVKGELIRQLKKDEAPAERVSMTVGVSIIYVSKSGHVGGVDDGPLGLAPGCSLI